MSIGRKFLLGAALVALGLAHLLFWYAPRERAMATSGARLLGDAATAPGDADWALWMPYPHQNLPALAGGGEELDGWIRAAARAAGQPQPFRFGPLAIPPCREIVISGYADGTVTVAAQIYPAVGLFARAAGAVARNPWLAGGSVVDGSTQSAGRAMEVAWREGVWAVGPPGHATVAPTLAAAASGAELAVEPGAEIGLLELFAFAGPMPPGLYRLDASADEIRLETLGTTPGAPALGSASPTLLLYAGPASRVGRSGSGLALFAGDRSASGPNRFEIPELGVFYRDADDRWRLPAEGLARLLGNETEVWRDWGIRAWNRSAVDRIRSLLVTGETDAVLDDPDLGFLAVVGLTEARHLVGSVAGALEAVPITGRREAERWRAWQELLEACTDCRRLEVVVRSDRATARLER